MSGATDSLSVRQRRLLARTAPFLAPRSLPSGRAAAGEAPVLAAVELMTFEEGER